MPRASDALPARSRLQRDVLRARRLAARAAATTAQRRRIVLAGQDVDYRLVRARRRSIGMQIDLAASRCARRAG